MALRRVPVRPVRLEYLCDRCAHPVESATASATVRGSVKGYVVACPGCNALLALPERYPKIVWEEVP